MRKTTWFLIAVAACSGAPEGGIPAGQRLVSGEVHLLGADGASQRPSLQLVGVHAAPECAPAGGVRVGDAAPDGAVRACAIFGEPFDAAAGPFRLLLPCDVTVNLLVQRVGAGGARAPGDLLAVVEFPTGVTPEETTTLFAREPACRDTPRLATNVLDLGTVAVPATPADAPAAVLIGGPGGGENPLATIDTDGDAVANLADPDDDEDGMPDTEDEDRDGDGAVDAAQVFTLDWWRR